jgi:hypothetical protein
MTRRKSGRQPKTEERVISVTADAPEEAPPCSDIWVTGPRACGAPEVQKTDDIGVKGEGGEFIKRGGQLIRS